MTLFRENDGAWFVLVCREYYDFSEALKRIQAKLFFSRKRYLEPLFGLLCHCRRLRSSKRYTCRSKRVNNKHISVRETHWGKRLRTTYAFSLSLSKMNVELVNFFLCTFSCNQTIPVVQRLKNYLNS